MSNREIKLVDIVERELTIPRGKDCVLGWLKHTGDENFPHVGVIGNYPEFQKDTKLKFIIQIYEVIEK